MRFSRRLDLKALINTTRRIILRDKAGVTAVEYALIAGVMVALVAVAFGTLGGSISNEITKAGNMISSPTSNG
jgi:Flp pilus assembly pilin Flp